MSPRPETSTTPARRRTLWIGAGIFLLALLLRLLFWRATSDATWPGSLAYKGDAYVWLEQAYGLQRGGMINEGLPLRPPGMAYLLSWIWNGTFEGIEALRGIWCVLGALGVWAFFLALVQPFGLRAATIGGVLAALSTSLLLLSNSLSNETPYLILVLFGLALNARLLKEPRLLELGAWGALNAGACLVRAEHVLFFGLCLLHLGWCWRATFTSWRTLLCLGTPLVVFALALAPWQLHAWSLVAAFNRGDLVNHSPEVENAYLGVERRTAGVRWDAEALRVSEELPGFIRRPARGFVAATRWHRGERTVRAEDLSILDEAYGYYPQPIASHPFICTYGPLNFCLANHARATGGFGRGPLDDPPLLMGGPQRYPPDLIVGTPPPSLSFSYTPHLGVFNEGYARGWAWIRSAPGDFVSLAGRKLGRFTAGATLGVGGFGWPLGLSGTRQPVDLVVPGGGVGVRLWSLALFALAAFGAWRARRRPEMMPWLLFLLSKLIVTVCFFGYARQGALVVPVVILLVVLAVEFFLSIPRFAARPRLLKRLAAASWIAVALLLASDGLRCLNGVSTRLDGVVVGDRDPLPPGDHEERRIEFGS